MPEHDTLISPAQRFKTACAMLRNAGLIDKSLPGQLRGESRIDWLVRLGLAPTPQVAAEMLILGAGLKHVLDELTGRVEQGPPAQPESPGT